MSLAELARPGRNAIPYVDAGNPDRPLTLHVYRPTSYTPAQPVVLVQHGVLRNGDAYRDFWIPAADRYGLLVVAPTFSNEAYPSPDSYNNGLARDSGGALRPHGQWAYAALARVWRQLQEDGITTRARAHLFGHSAGGQFVHRLLATQAHDCIETAIAGNPGWYTLPTLDRPFPEGLGGISLDEDHLRRFLGFPLIILAGDQDTATSDTHLPSHEEALRQGPHRFARAQYYVEFGRKEAARLGVPFAWRLQVVPGIGHDGEAMSAVAASLWFDGKLPDAAELKRLAGQRAA
ncbi:MAG TPA: alpha/beta hydrolase [Alphaproteobacteria bacterium]|nr:alpha/beta hydrolase [Alphaproteobacteria bacterium]